MKVRDYFEKEKARLASRYAETEIELEILEAAWERVEESEVDPEEKERLKKYLSGLQERDRGRLKILTERTALVSQILDKVSLTTV